MKSAAPFKRRWLMCDYARQRVFIRDEFLLWLDKLAELGYNGLGIYLEGAFDFDSIPGVIREGVMTPEDAAWAVSEGKKRGIFVFPMTNVVGHMEHFFSQERNRALMDTNPDANGMQMNFLLPQAEEYAMNIVHEYARHFGADMVHIGGDETTLTPENRMIYARFLAKLCNNLLAEGIQPAVWADMIWMDPPLCEPFSRDVFIFDWNYYGHRPESIRFFNELGFRDVIVCPCDNSWEGIINYQHTTGYLKARTDLPVKPYEIEAFFEDAAKEGVFSGIMTNWENAYGRNMWAQWVPIARSALYMNGLIDSGELCDEQIEKALFGRVTPYSEVTHLLQNAIQRTDLDFDWFVLMREATFLPKQLSQLISKASHEKPAFPEEFDQALVRIEEKLSAWTPESEFESLCLSGMHGAVAIVRGANEIIKAGRGYQTFYVRAAQLQFTSPDAAAQLLDRFSGLFRHAAYEIQNTIRIFGAAIEKTGHTKNDLTCMKEIAGLLIKVADSIDLCRAEIARIPLPRFETILQRVIR